MRDGRRLATCLGQRDPVEPERRADRDVRARGDVARFEAESFGGIEITGEDRARRADHRWAPGVLRDPHLAQLRVEAIQRLVGARELATLAEVEADEAVEVEWRRLVRRARGLVDDGAPLVVGDVVVVDRQRVREDVAQRVRVGDPARHRDRLASQRLPLVEVLGRERRERARESRHHARAQDVVGFGERRQGFAQELDHGGVRSPRGQLRTCREAGPREQARRAEPAWARGRGAAAGASALGVAGVAQALAAHDLELARDRAVEARELEGALGQTCGLFERESVECGEAGVARDLGDTRGIAAVVTFDQVMCRAPQVRAEQHLAGAAMQRGAARRRQRRGQPVAQERVHEREPIAPARLDDARGPRALEPRGGSVRVELGERRHLHRREVAPEHGRARQQRAHVRVDARELLVEDRLQADRQPARIHAPARAQHLAHEQRVALRERAHLGGIDGRVGIVGGDPRAHVGVVEAWERDHVALAADLREPRRGVGELRVDVAVGADHEQAAAHEIARDDLQQLQRRRVGRVEIVEHDRERRGVAQRSRGALEAAEPTLARIHRAGGVGERIREIERLEHLRPRPERRRAAGLPAAAPSDA